VTEVATGSGGARTSPDAAGRAAPGRSPHPSRAVVVANPLSIDLSVLRPVIEAEERRNGWLPSAWVATAAEPDGRVSRAVIDSDASLVIVAGGDGTIRAVADELHPSGIPVGIVPGGTGNLLARNLGLVADLDAAVRTAFTGAERALDVGRITLEYPDKPSDTRRFLVMTGVGLDARMATDTNGMLKKRLGWVAYVDPISRSVLRNRQFLMHYRVDGGREHSVHAHTVIVGNCGTLTGGMVLLPDAQPDDGLLDVVLFRPKGFWQWLRVGGRLGIGGLLHRTPRGRKILRATTDLRTLPYTRAERLTARFDRPESIELDGDSFGSVVAVTVAVEPGALHVRVPKL
jgi:YegS/Rv2252/BmrU family lipid kinase